MRTLVLLFFSLAAHATCDTTYANLQKKILVDYIYKYPFNFGNEIKIRKVDTISCSTQKKSRYRVIYRDVLCRDLNDPERDSYSCDEVLCKSIGEVSPDGQVSFDLAPVKNCQKI